MGIGLKTAEPKSRRGREVLNGLDLFSGIGGISLALRPWVRPIAYCESDRYCQGVILSRMQQGEIGEAPICDDVRSLTHKMLPREIDIIYAGFPCQPYSSAARGRNKSDTMVQHLLRLIGETKPNYVFTENTQEKAIERVSAYCESIGYKASILVTEASEVGAPFIGKRYWGLATSNSDRKSALQFNDEMAELSAATKNPWTEVNRKSLRVVDGVPFEVDRTRALGNAVVPHQAREAFKRLMGIQ